MEFFLTFGQHANMLFPLTFLQIWIFDTRGNILSILDLIFCIKWGKCIGSKELMEIFCSNFISFSGSPVCLSRRGHVHVTLPF